MLSEHLSKASRKQTSNATTYTQMSLKLHVLLLLQQR